MSQPELPFTGERFTPECVREIWYEHWHRYAFALPLVRGRRVLDAACGEGYGSALLARSAASVVGADLSTEAIEHARQRYCGHENLRFDVADVTALDVAPGSFDLVVSFETLEHVEAQDAMLAGFARALTDDGLLLVSSPDRYTYSDLSGYRNEFHVRELYRDEFESLIARHFPAHRLYGQKLLFQSALWALDTDGGALLAQTSDRGAQEVTDGFAYAPLYFVAVCAKHKEALDGLPALGLFGDREESVYRHYNDEVRRHIAAGHRLIELEAEVARLKALLERA
ncbi:MAG TPA: class I SAM-dependent methyltransferase [Xanthomonadaceae bacterium]|nr:class I SAM-dependent methyltransferase [Xanthomonadaceae bacterium]